MTPTTSCSVLIPAGPRRQSGTVTLLLASAITVLAGCGASDPAFTAGSVATQASDTVRASLPEGAAIDQFECVEDGDNEHWLCRSFYRGPDDVAFSVTVRYTCDPETGRCIGESSITPG